MFTKEVNTPLCPLNLRAQVFLEGSRGVGVGLEVGRAGKRSRKQTTPAGIVTDGGEKQNQWDAS
jgi:hypothetical protein